MELATTDIAIVVGAAVVVFAAIMFLLRRRRAGTGSYESHEQVLSPVVANLIAAPAPGTKRLTIPPRAAFAGRVPGPGVLAVAGVELPTGRPTRSVESVTVELMVGDGDPGPSPTMDQMWVASHVTRSANDAWRRLAAGFSETGLWPLLIPGSGDSSGVMREWIDTDAHRHGADDLEVAERLRRRLNESLTGGSPLSSTGLLAQSSTAQGALTRGSGKRTDALGEAFALIGDARLALAPGRRPADVLHAIAWPGADDAGIPTAELADIVASWEERWGALLMSVTKHTMLLAILRPPTTFEEAVEALAEQHALCPDEADEWRDDDTGARSLIDVPIWRLSWH